MQPQVAGVNKFPVSKSQKEIKESFPRALVGTFPKHFDDASLEKRLFGCNEFCTVQPCHIEQKYNCVFCESCVCTHTRTPLVLCVHTYVDTPVHTCAHIPVHTCAHIPVHTLGSFSGSVWSSIRSLAPCERC